MSASSTGAPAARKVRWRLSYKTLSGEHTLTAVLSLSCVCVCPPAWRVLIALEEKRVPYRGVCVSFASGVLKTPFFRALNPRMRVPVLVEPVDGAAPPAANTEVAAIAQGISHLLALPQERVVVTESAAILEFLERKFPGTPSMPPSLPLYALAQSRMHEANEILSVVGDLVVYLRRFPKEMRNAGVVASKWASVESELGFWERQLEGKSFLVDADTPYNCDFTLFTNVAYAVRCGLRLDGLYPRLAAFYARLCARASIDETWPPHWRLSPGSRVLTKCFYCKDKPECVCESEQQQPAPKSGGSVTSSE